MKTLILTLITLTFSSCGTIKSLNRIKSSDLASKKTIASEKTIKLTTYANAANLTDSKESLYKIIIYPLDTFQFSVQKGFKGKATKVELTALTKRASHKTDATAITTLTNHQKQLNSAKKTNNKSIILTKTSRSTKNYWLLALSLILALVISITWFYKKLQR